MGEIAPNNGPTCRAETLGVCPCGSGNLKSVFPRSYPGMQVNIRVARCSVSFGRGEVLCRVAFEDSLSSIGRIGTVVAEARKQTVKHRRFVIKSLTSKRSGGNRTVPMTAGHTRQIPSREAAP
jgi:hypothetical protein